MPTSGATVHGVSSRRRSASDDQLVMPGFEEVATPEPTADAKQQATPVIAKHADVEHPEVATAIIEFIEAGFPRDAWKAKPLHKWITQHLFGVDWPSGADEYYKRWFAHPGTQFEWLKQVLQNKHYRIAPDQRWQETERAVRIEISSRLYKQLADADKRLWTPPRQTIGTPEPPRTHPSYYRTFRSTGSTSSDFKVEIATEVVQFIERGFRWDDYTVKLDQAMGTFLDVTTHYNRRGTYDVTFGYPEGPANWLAFVVRDWEKCRGNWGGDWADIKAGLHEVIVDRGYHDVFVRRADQQRRQSSEDHLAALIEAMPDVAERLLRTNSRSAAPPDLAM